MAKEVISKIIEIESKAKRIIDEAKHATREIAKKARSEKEKIKAEAEVKVKKKREKVLSKTKAEAEAQIKSIERETLREISESKKVSKANISKAKSLVLEKVKKNLCL